MLSACESFGFLRVATLIPAVPAEYVAYRLLSRRH
jgi:hypothetical protein